MKKRFLILMLMLAACLSGCAARSIPAYADASALAGSLYENAGLSSDALYAESLERVDAFRFGVTITDFDNMVEDAVCYRKTVDQNGQMLYALKMRSKEDSDAFAKAFYAHYEFAPCDVAEKMAIVSAGEYVIFFKSDVGEVDAAVEAFRTLMNGHLDFEKELINRG